MVRWLRSTYRLDDIAQERLHAGSGVEGDRWQFHTRTLGEHLRGAVDLAAAKMERQLKKNNGKRKHHKGHTPEPAPEASASPQADAEETYEDAVRESLQG